jgi:hypothetical protein
VDAQRPADHPVARVERRRRAVGREHEAPARRDDAAEAVEQAAEVRAQRGLAQHRPQPEADPGPRLGRGDGLVVGGDARRRQGGEPVERGAGGVPLRAPARGARGGDRAEQPRLAARDVAPAGDLARERDLRPAQLLVDGRRREPRLVLARAGLRRGADVPPQVRGQARDGVDDGAVAGDAEADELEEVVQDERRRAVRHGRLDEARRRVQHPRVGVRLDVAGHDDAPAGVDLDGVRPGARRARADVGDPAAGDLDVRGDPLAGVDVGDRPARHDGVGRRASLGDLQQRRRGAHAGTATRRRPRTRPAGRSSRPARCSGCTSCGARPARRSPCG